MIENTIAWPQNVLLHIWTHLDYITASRVRELDKTRLEVINKLFPEMEFLQKMSLGVYEDREKLIDKEKCELSFFQNKINKDLNLMREYRSLVQSENCFSKLFGGAKALMTLPISLSLPRKQFPQIKPENLPSVITKVIEKETNKLYFFIREQKSSFFLLFIGDWKQNHIYKISGKDFSITYQENNTSFDDKIYRNWEHIWEHEKKELLFEGEMPYWRVQQVFFNAVSPTIISRECLCFGIKINSNSFKDLENAINLYNFEDSAEKSCKLKV